MAKSKAVIKRPRKSGVNFDDMYYELSHQWRRKAEAMRIRRWRALKREIKGVGR